MSRSPAYQSKARPASATGCATGCATGSTSRRCSSTRPNSKRCSSAHAWFRPGRHRPRAGRHRRARQDPQRPARPAAPRSVAREDGATSERTLWPLGLFFWGRHWTLIGWCLLRDEFRHFRVDRIGQLTVSEERFPDQSGRRLADFFDSLEQAEEITIPRQ
ncbi:YafY family protein [Propionivibrio sp.]|uniref:helix-turn-helix transcriptional regulator n=1 Tax=Propionivibrio sp. TaxID=2212460 RepID=UPI0025CD8A36|nr:WYL domain-containing protein [Propionivibrio sp.]